MIDRFARDQMAELIRHVASGAISTESFFDRGNVVAESSNDEAVPTLFEGAWDMVIDFQSDRSMFRWNAALRFHGKHRLSSAERQPLCRAIVFLHSSMEIQKVPPGPKEIDLQSYGCFYALAGMGMVGGELILLWNGWPVGLLSMIFLAMLVHLIHIEIGYHRMLSVLPLQAWPFRSAEDLETALLQPRLLAGVRR